MKVMEGKKKELLRTAERFLTTVYKDDIIAIATIVTAVAEDDVDTVVDFLKEIEKFTGKLRVELTLAQSLQESEKNENLKQDD